MRYGNVRGRISQDIGQDGKRGDSQQEGVWDGRGSFY